jgi:fluoroacetyl-CoA thioesterase
MKQIRIGTRGRLQETVGAQHSAEQFGNRDVRVLGTPVLCHWFESASVLAITNHLDQGEASVGTQLEIEHLRATPIGMKVSVDAEVVAVDGRRVRFKVEARDEREMVARGTHERYVVELKRFLQGVQSKVVAS